MKKHLLLILFTLAALLTGIFALAACDAPTGGTTPGGDGPSTDQPGGDDPTPSEHVHTWGDWVVTTPADCDTDGVETRTCLTDPTHTETQPIAQLGHDWQEDSVKPATCTEIGTRTFKCARCESTNVEEIDMIDHDWQEQSVTPATCTTAGSHNFACALCGATSIEPISELGHKWAETAVIEEATCLKEGSHTVRCETCGDTETTTIPKTEHQYGEWMPAVGATCTSKGLDKRVCPICESEETKETEMIAHSPDLVAGREATCDEGGLTDCWRCSMCGKYSRTADGAFDISDLSDAQTVTAAKGHGFEEWDVVLEPTCQTLGQSERRCTQCSHTEVKDIDKKEHVYGDWVETDAPTCTKTGTQTRTCTSCEIAFETQTVAMLDHNFDENNWKTEKAATCTAEGTETNVCTICKRETKTRLTEKAAHTVVTLEKVDAGCDTEGLTEGQKCSVCNAELVPQTVIPVLGHKWGKWQQDLEKEGYHTHICENDPKHTESMLCAYTDETVVPATCTEDGHTYKTCGECGDTIETAHEDARGHSYGKWVSMVEDESQSHIHKHYRVCANCSEGREEDVCELTVIKTETATCTVSGYTLSKCNDCGAEHEAPDPENPAKGHSYVYESKRGSFLSSQHRQKCTVCGDVTEYVSCVLEDHPMQATCTTPLTHVYRCSLCEQQFKTTEGNEKGLGHVWLSPEFDPESLGGEHQHIIKCSRCEEEKKEPCDIVETKTLPTCTTSGTVKRACKVCLHSEESEGDVSVGHKWENDGAYTYLSNGRHQRVCTVCGTKDIVACGVETQSVPATCTEKAQRITRCPECKNETVEYIGESFGHVWETEYIDETTHRLSCKNCTEKEEKAHDWRESNLCAGCGYDGLDYEISGIHCYVTGDKRVMNSKNIVIPAKHKVLSGGGYANNEYTVTEIKTYAFQANDNMQSVSIPAGVTTIGEYAFFSCRKLESVTIDGNALTEIKRMAFHSCGALAQFSWPTSLHTIGDGAFENCTSLNSIVLGDDVTTIGEKAFLNTGYVNDHTHWGDSNILYMGRHLIKAHNEKNADGSYVNAVIDVRDDTYSIAAHAFSDCTGLTKIILPSSVKVVDANAFRGCNALKEVVFEGTFTEWMMIDFENDYASPLHNSDVTFHIDGANGDITIPSTVTRIPAGTFRNTQIKSIVIPASVTYIGEEAFENCASLASVTIEGSNVSYIGKDAFKGSKYYLDESKWTDGKALYIDHYLVAAKENIKDTYTVQSGTLLIANSAFAGCKELKGVVINSELKYIGDGAFALDGKMESLTFTDTSCRWYASGRITRSLSVESNMWYTYKALHYGEWHKMISV